MSANTRGETVFGVEQEYTACSVASGGKSLEPEVLITGHEMTSYLKPTHKTLQFLTFENIQKAYESLGILYGLGHFSIKNGARLYDDASGIEYATPESRTAQEAVLRSFDGDEVAYAMFTHLLKSRALKSFQLNRRSTDIMRNKRATHINISLPEKDFVFTDRAKEAYMGLNVAKGAVCGSGGLLMNLDGSVEYHHSPRLSVTTVEDSGGSLNSAPLFRSNLKKELSNSRLESVTDDAHNFAWPFRASIVMTNALTTMVVAGMEDSIPVLVNPVQDAHNVGKHGFEGMVTVKQKNGNKKSMACLDYLVDIISIMQEAGEKKDFFDEETVQVLAEVKDVTDLLRSDMYKAKRDVESVTRLLFMQELQDRQGLTLDSNGVLIFDYNWDRIGGGLAEQIREKTKIGWRGFDQRDTPETREWRLNNPPQDTRAKVRVSVLQQPDNKVNKVWWHYLEKVNGFVHLTPWQTELDSAKKPVVVPPAFYPARIEGVPIENYLE